MIVQRERCNILSVGLLVSALTGAASVQADTFGPPTTYTLASSAAPTAPVSCDLDGDGWVDAAVIEGFHNRVGILFNDATGFGSLATPPLYVNLGTGPTSLTCADLDGDDDFDLAASNYQGNSLSIVRNDGNRSFSTFVIPLGAGTGPRSVVAADLNDDGITDLVSGNNPLGVNDTFTVLMGSGGGTFSSPATSSSGAGGTARIRVADLDGDDYPDLAVADDLANKVWILLGNGNGTFASPLGYTTDTGPQYLATCDVDGDVDLDIVTNAVFVDKVCLLRNNGDGSFAAFEVIATVNNPNGVACGDLDDDGDADVMAGGSDDVVLLLNDGTGSFPTAELYAGAPVSELSIGYLSDDCLPDVVLAGSPNRLVVLINGGAHVDFGNLYTAGTCTAPLAEADFDADGFADLVCADANHPGPSQTLFVLLNNGDGTFGSGTAIVSPCGTGIPATVVMTSDLDADGDVDIGAGCLDPNVFLLMFNNGDGTFGTPVSVAGVVDPQYLAACDLDDDGDIDLVGGGLNAPSNLAVFRNDGGGTYVRTADLEGAEPRGVACADFDADNRPDVAAVFSQDFASVFYNNGDGTFEQQALIVGDDPRGMIVCDINNDFLPDLVTPGLTRISVLKNLGNGNFAPYFNTGNVQMYNVVDCCDIDIDGANDLVTDAGPSNAAVYRNNGTGLFQFAGTVLMNTPGARCADLNADQSPDLFTGDSGSLRVRLNQIPPPFLFVDQPDNVTVFAGDPVAFQVTVVSGEPIAYQWYRNDTAIAGETSPTLTIPYALPQHEGLHTALCGGDCASLPSAAAMLQVIGDCVPGTPPECNDANPCTDDSCDVARTCVHVNNTQACEDGNMCTTTDACVSGVCTAGPPLICDDSNLCTTDSCIPQTGCRFTSNHDPCDDGDSCTLDDECSGGACAAGGPRDCSDGNGCTQDTCDAGHPSADPLTGCVNTPTPEAACDDGDACTTNDTCNAQAACGGTPIVALYGDVHPPGGNGVIDVDDLLCVLDGFSGIAPCDALSDIFSCGGNGVIDVDDILAELDAFSGTYACPHPCPP